MCILRVLALAAFIPTLALADEPKTVTLTQAQLQQFITAEVAKAEAQILANQAKGVYDLVNQTFSPPKSVAPPTSAAPSVHHGPMHPLPQGMTK